MAFLSRKREESCASCSAFYYMGLAGEQNTGRGQCLAHPVPLPKQATDWCREYVAEKNPEPELKEDGLL